MKSWIAPRLAKEYPADYVLAWCEWVHAHLDEIDKPGGYLYRCITSGEWPPDPPPVAEVGPRPAPQARQTSCGTRRVDGPTNMPSEQERSARATERPENAKVSGYLKGLSESDKEALVLEQLPFGPPEMVEQYQQNPAHDPLHRLARSAILLAGVRRRLGLSP